MANRFTGPILALRQLSKEDYELMLRRCVRSLPKGLAGKVEGIGRKSLDDAVDNRLGVRWLEEIMLRALIHREEVGASVVQELPKIG